MDIMLGSCAKTKLLSQGTTVGTLRRWRELLSNFSAHAAPSAITMSAMLQIEIPAIAVPIPRPKRCVPRCSTTSMLPKAIAPPVHVVVGALPATPIALQKWPPRHLALLPSHDSIDSPRRWVRRWLRHKPLRGRRGRRMLRLLWLADLRDIIDISALRCGGPQ